MIIFTDDINLSEEYFSGEIKWIDKDLSHNIPLNAFLSADHYTGIVDLPWWKYAIITKDAPRSQYDIMIRLAKENHALPDKMILLAATGKDFHGFRNRRWEAHPGNLHLSVYFTPNKEIIRFGSEVMALPAVSVVQAIDEIENIKEEPMIKWVNDINFGRAKVSGVLAHTQAMGKKLNNIILGIGLNVEHTPNVAPSPSVPLATCLWENILSIDKPKKSEVLDNLLKHLKMNYEFLYEGMGERIINIYRDRSMIINKEIMVYDDAKADEPVISRGIVERIGKNLELYLINQKKPITKGRLVLL